jgi:hypothetical protein
MTRTMDEAPGPGEGESRAIPDTTATQKLRPRHMRASAHFMALLQVDEYLAARHIKVYHPSP